MGSDRDRLIDLMRDCSVEVSARDDYAGERLGEIMAPGRTIYINYAPGDTHHGAVAAARRLRDAGFNPVPHVVARYLASYTQLNDYLLRLNGEAAVDQALVVAGDVARPVGPFESSLQLLKTGLFAKAGIRRIGIAGYPEGHPRVAMRVLDDALHDKIALAREIGLATYVVTQFGFEAEPILDWIRRLRQSHIGIPIHVGLAGPASLATLTKFALRCGVGQSLRALYAGQTSVTRLLTEAGPERVIKALIADKERARDIAGLHFFTFGGVRRTGAWIGAAERGEVGI